MSFGEVLKKLRTESSLTQQQLADRLNLSKANVSKYESNLVEPNLETLRLITKVFNVNSDYLLEIKTNPTNNLFSDQMSESVDTDKSFTVTETQLIKNRLLDTYGQKAVNHILDIEYERCSKAKEESEIIQIPYVARSETGEDGTLERTQKEINKFTSKLKPDTSGKY